MESLAHFKKVITVFRGNGLREEGTCCFDRNLIPHIRREQKVYGSSIGLRDGYI
jgi:hypothetical protein